MDNLPPEILLNIFSLVDHQTNIAIRSVSKALEPVASSIVFNEYRLACIPCLVHSFHRFTSTRLARHVRKLVVYGDQLFPVVERWKKFRTSPRDIDAEVGDIWDPLKAGPLPKWVLDTLRIYRALYEDQQRWNQDFHGEILSLALSALPNLTETTVLDKRLAPDWDNLSWPLADALYSELNNGLYRNAFDLDWHEQYVLEGYAVIAVLQGLMARARLSNTRPITKLNLQMKWALQKPLGLKTKSTSCMQSALANLTNLKFFYHFGLPEDAFEGASPLESEIGNLLVAAPELKSLELTCDGPNIHCATALRTLDILKAPIRSRLSDLSITINAHVSNLTSYLETQAASLKSLRLEFIRLEDPVELLETIPKVLKLERVFLKQLSNMVHDSDRGDRYWNSAMMITGTDADFDEAREMREYLLGRRAIMPNLYNWPRESAPA